MAIMKKKLVVCVQLENESVEEMKASMEKAKEEGADLLELHLDSITHLDTLINSRPLPTIVSYKPFKSSGSSIKTSCMQVLKRALELDVEFIEIDYEVASDPGMVEHINNRRNCKIIVSSYVRGGNPSAEKLGDLIAQMQSTGATLLKLEIPVDYITDLAPIFQMLTYCQVPLIVVAVGSRGLISQLLAPKFGGFLVYGSLEEKPVPGLPSLSSLRKVYKLENLNADTKVFGLISNPVGHSKSPFLHNNAFRHIGFNGIYVPMQVDDIKEFFRIYTGHDFAGFSVGIPHKEAAMACCDEVHPLAKSIGAVNTIIRRPIDGKLVGYNTDCEASISAIEDALRGAGGAGRALAFGAKTRGAKIVIFNRNYDRAKALAKAVSGEALPFESLDNFSPENGMILANASAIGMQPNSNQTPISKESLKAYELVFDAVYTPKNTRLLQEAAEVGAIVVSGVEMFIRQALAQFQLFTHGSAPEDFMRKLLEQF
ncbi:hypothetical protein ACFE04_000054 [Oxalis oulophora]